MPLAPPFLLRLTQQQLIWLDAWRAGAGLSRNAAVRQLLKDAMAARLPIEPR